MDAPPIRGGVASASLTHWELTTVGDDVAVAFRGTEVRRYDDLEPDTEYSYDGLTFRTLARPPGERLATVATVNDVHFGETECGVMGEGGIAAEMGPTFRSEPGEAPYPETMNRAAIAEITAIEPDAVIAKGDLTGEGTEEEYAAFLAAYQPAFGDRLHHVRGNHDAYHGGTFAAFPTQRVDVAGGAVTLAILDTSIPGSPSGTVSDDQLAWLDDIGAAADAALVFGHHHAWKPGSKSREPTYYGIHPDASERLVDVFSRRPSLAGYFAGHTHRNRVRRFAQTGGVPWVEVACVKDFPGAWAEYRVHEGGYVQLVHRISAPEALAWTERTRGMFGGLYPTYAFGELPDRCFTFVHSPT